MSETEYALGYHCGVTFAGIKPASLISLKKEPSDAVDYYAERFAGKGFRFERMRESEERLLLYVYNFAKLKEVLFDEENFSFLKNRGYRYATTEEAVEELRGRLTGAEFPHEIGVFLGYALEDVKGFIENPVEGVQLTGCWKVYGNAAEKAKLFDRYKRCSACILGKLQSGKPLAAIFNAK